MHNEVYCANGTSSNSTWPQTLSGTNGTFTCAAGYFASNPSVSCHQNGGSATWGKQSLPTCLLSSRLFLRRLLAPNPWWSIWHIHLFDWILYFQSFCVLHSKRRIGLLGGLNPCQPVYCRAGSSFDATWPQILSGISGIDLYLCHWILCLESFSVLQSNWRIYKIHQQHQTQIITYAAASNSPNDGAGPLSSWLPYIIYAIYFILLLVVFLVVRRKHPLAKNSSVILSSGLSLFDFCCWLPLHLGYVHPVKHPFSPPVDDHQATISINHNKTTRSSFVFVAWQSQSPRIVLRQHCVGGCGRQFVQRVYGHVRDHFGGQELPRSWDLSCKIQLAGVHRVHHVIVQFWGDGDPEFRVAWP